MSLDIPKIKTYSKDKRIPIKRLYKEFLKINANLEIIHYQKIKSKKYKNILLPILGFITKKQGNALWLIAGIHGEEPAGVNAIARNIKYINKISKKIPLVILPLCNPAGYLRNWRYPNKKRRTKKGINASVGDSEHLLLDIKNKRNPRRKKPICKESEYISNFVIKTSKTHKPMLVIDFHEDESSKKIYIYSQGKLGNRDPTAKKIVLIIKNKGFKFINSGKTSFSEDIINGIVSNIKDGSIDELLASKKIIINNKIKKGPSAKSAIVIETNTLNFPLKKRVNVHSKILKKSENFYKTTIKI